MDELMISGRRYLSSLRAAKEHGYHSDYIGQLIRGDKVKGQKVGRAWYVDAESLSTYLGKTAASPPESPSVQIEKSEQQPHEKSLVEPAGRPEDFSKEVDVGEHHIKIIKIEETAKEKIPTPDASVGAGKVSGNKTGLTYVADDTPLLPEIRKGQKLSRPPEVIVEEVPVKIINKDQKPSPKASYLWQGMVIAGLGVFMLVAVTAVSILFVSELKVGTTQSANVHFSLPR